MKDIKKTGIDFNKFYSSMGWISYEAMSFSIVEKAVELAEQSKTDEGEELLLDYYNSSNIDKHLSLLNNKPFKDRWDFVKEAEKLFIEGRYIACIPLQLMIIDGVVNDVDNVSGFATPATQMSVWDSTAGDVSGLPEIQRFFTCSRTKTNIELVKLPYRNGILHGRDLNYGNNELACKCWGIIFAIGSWISKKMTMKHRYTAWEKDNNKTISDLTNELNEINRQRDICNKWKPRSVLVEAIKQSFDCDDYSPEKAFLEFCELGQKNNYGEMYLFLSKQFKTKNNIRDFKKKVKQIAFEDIKLIKVEHKAISLAKLKVMLNNKEINVVMNLVDGDDKLACENLESTKWKIWICDELAVSYYN